MQSVLAAPLAARGQHKIASRCLSLSLSPYFVSERSKIAIARARSVTCRGEVDLRQIAV